MGGSEKTSMVDKRRSKRFEIATSLIIDKLYYQVNNVSIFGCAIEAEKDKLLINRIYSADLILNNISLNLEIFVAHYNENKKMYGLEFIFPYEYDREIVNKFIELTRGMV